MAQKKNEGGLLKSPLLKNIVVIALLMVAMLVVAHILMLWGTRHGARRVVPDLSGVALSDAERIARENDLELHINDSLFVPAYAGGIILDQLPEGGVEVKPGRTVYITINSFRQKMVPVPYVAGRSLRQAKNMLEIAGLEIKELIYRPDMATNYVLEQFCDRQQILADSRVEAEMGSGITLYVGVEPAENIALVPQVVGLSLRDAKSRLWESGLNVGKIDFEGGITLLNQKEARLYAQSPSAETATTLGSEVTLRLTLDTEKVKNSRTEAERQAREAMEERLKAEQAEQDSLARLTLEQTLEQAIEQTEAAASEENFFE